MVAVSYATGSLFSSASCGEPWKRPQSMTTLARSVSSRNWEPVTVVAAPRNVRRMDGCSQR